MPDEKRGAERIGILGELRGEIMVFEPISIKEIGQGGIQVETPFPLQLDSLHELRLILGEQSVIVKGRVAHSRICDVYQDIVTYRSGLEFVELSDRIESAIIHFLVTIRASRHAV